MIFLGIHLPFMRWKKWFGKEEISTAVCQFFVHILDILALKAAKSICDLQNSHFQA